MKKISLLLFIFLTASIGAVVAQTYQAGDITGTWLNEDKDAHIKIYEENGKFYGRIVWLKNPIDEETGEPKKDKENPDKVLQQRSLKGLVVLKDFVYEGDGEWEDRTIYDPKSGKTYSCYMELQSQDKLKIRGYIGVSLLGRTSYFTRVEN